MTSWQDNVAGVPLTTKQRVALLLEQGRTVREIAAELDLTTQAVYEQLKGIRELQSEQAS